MATSPKSEKFIKRLTELYFELSQVEITDSEKDRLKRILYKIYHQMSDDKLKEHYKNCLISITVFNKNPFGENYIESLTQPTLAVSPLPIVKQQKKPILDGAALKDVLNDIFMYQNTHTISSLKDIVDNLIENSQQFNSSKEEKRVLKYLDSADFWGEVNDLDNLNNINKNNLLNIINYNENNKKQAFYKLVLK